MKSLVHDRPKPMAQVAGRPFVEWLLLKLRSQGIRHIIFCSGYMGEMLEDYFKDGSCLGLDIEYSRESEPMGTAGAVCHALRRVRGERFFVLNGDSYCCADIMQLFNFHCQVKSWATILLVHMDDCRRYGTVIVNADNSVRFFQEKRLDPGPGLINSGIYLFERKMAETIPLRRKISLEIDILPNLIAEGLYALECPGDFIDIGIPETYLAADSFFRKLEKLCSF
nr:nucleotidyltransferase family protein [uncultured Desulfobacter sp.]